MDLSDAVIVSSTRLKSVVWQDFDRFKKGDTCVAVCKHCEKKLSGSSTSGTSHLRNHLIRCQRRSNPTLPQLLTAREKKKEALALATYTLDQEPKRDEALSLVNIKFEHDQVKDDMLNIGSNSNTFDQRQSQIDLARMIILHGYPLSMVDHFQFKVFVKRLQPLFDLVNVNGVEADCINIYEDEKQKVRELLDKLSSKISISIDTWLSMDDVAKYLSLTAHYIDEDWQLKKKILNFNLVDPSHTEDTHSDIITTSLMDWNVEHKLFSMTFDSSLTSDNIALTIRDRLCKNRSLFSNGQFFDARCAVNVLKLMVEDAIEALYDVNFKIRECIRYVKCSQAIQEKFYNIAQQVGVSSLKSLCVDNDLLWNSTFFMLEAALEYKAAFCLLQEQEPAYTCCPSEIEWERASAIAGYLKIFIEFTNLITRTKNPTANIYFHDICALHLQLIEWCKTQDQYLGSLAIKMKTKFDEYWRKCYLGLAVAAILDPRYKLKLMEYFFPQIYGNESSERINEVSNCVRELYNEHSIGSPLGCNDPNLSWQVNGNGGDAMARDRLMGFDKYLHETSQSQATNSDFDKYLEEPLFPLNGDFSVLNWWKVHTPRYPVLAMMARNVLAVPMSKISLESAFNSRDRVLDRNRSSSVPSMVQALVCSQDWIQSELES